MLTNRFLLILILTCFLFGLLPGCGTVSKNETLPDDNADNPKKIEMYYFFAWLCASCDPLKDFMDLVETELKDERDLYPYTIIPLNIATTEGYKSKTEFLQDLGMDEDDIRLLSNPLLVINGNVYSGDNAIRNNLREAFLKAAESY